MPYKERVKIKGRMVTKYRAKVKHNYKPYTARLDTKAEAIVWEVETSKKLKQLDQAITPTTIDMACVDFFEKYLDYSDLHYVKKTASDKKALCRRLIKVWGDKKVSEITDEMVQDFLDKQAKVRSNNAYNKDRKNLLAMWSYGTTILKKHIKNNPILDIKTMSHHRKKQYVPPIPDVLKVLAVANRMEKIMLDCYLNTGARKREIFNLNWFEDINFEQRKLRLGTKKTADGSMEYVWVEMNDSLYKSLWWLWNNRPKKDSPYVFVCTHPGPWYGHPFTARRTFMHSLCKRAGVKYFGFHTLRRFVSSYLIDVKKISLKALQLILRHHNIRTTADYVERLGQDLKEEYAMLNDLQINDQRAHDGGTLKQNGGAE